MDLQNLRENSRELLAHMKSDGYSAEYISSIRCEITRIINNAELNGWVTYEDIHLFYSGQPTLPSYKREKRVRIGIIERFDEYGQFPDGKQHRTIFKEDNYHLLSDEFKAIIDYYKDSMSKRGLTAGSKKTNLGYAKRFFCDLQLSGIKTMSEITEDAILATFITNEGVWRRGYAFKNALVNMFQTCDLMYPDEFGRILPFLPELRKHRKNIQYLTPEEVEKLKEALSDNNSGLPLRDKAIGTLALYTGLRSSDIWGLTLDAIDWENDIITINQQKTGKILRIPLRAVVGNAIHDYLTLERPQSETRYLFLSLRRPFEHMGKTGLVRATNRIMSAANIRQTVGDRKGLHIFRHYLVTSLLGNDVPRPVVSSVVGHDSPESLEAYLSADFKHLKECALSLDRFGISKGVFGNA